MWNRKHELVAIFEVTADYAERLIASMESARSSELGMWDRLSAERHKQLRSHRNTVSASKDAIDALRRAVAELKNADSAEHI
jgi:polyhydroxyalkanoate synthesis regulator phasin